ncbi:unnamed protein product [Zymoseptoria tritici ST99CH_1A5]|uniref:Coiled-coil domain-containing protein 16 n=1 Tax=Zymoseptoria tritici ST99CH_1A5 TaxID=1276529 RepID=A0A1Y6LM26_ZYMTR|nr:unnamed protein product [Zymoseptoria tritici ST99CH_1A5]
MGDVRSMLRQQREARRITHPHASYTTDGKLLCNLCEQLIKSEATWSGHLHSTGHTLWQSRAQDAAVTKATNGGNKKRKAQDSPGLDERKKAKSVTFSAGVEEEEEEGEDSIAGPLQAPAESISGLPSNGRIEQANTEEQEDPAEMAAFERELAEMEASMAAEKAAKEAEHTISAPPMTAEEVAAQAREEQSTQRGKRDAELEAEKEDAVRMLEDEFDEMEGLEARARTLRERREALRRGRDAATEPTPDASDSTSLPIATSVADDDPGEIDDDEEDDEDDVWLFGGN